MSILSTNTKLVNVGHDYSAGENIGIYEHTISSRNWSPDITYAAESAFQRATGYTDAQFSALSGEVSDEVSQLGSDIDYISGVALTSHQSLEGYLTKASGDEYYQPIGSYATVSQLESTSGEIVNLIPTDYVNTETLEQTSGNIVNLIPDTSEFITNASAEQTYQHIGNYLSSNALEGYATQDWVQDQGYLTGVDLSNYYTKNETSGADELAEAFSQIGPGGDEEVNEFVYNNSATILDVDTTYQQNSATYLTAHQDISNKLDTTAFSTVSGTFLTAAPADMATTGDVAELAQTVSETYQVKGDYAERDFVLSSIESATSGKLDVSSFASVSSDFMTNDDLNGYATESFVQDTSANITALIPTNYYPDNNPSGFISGVDLTPYATTAEVDTLSSMLSAAVDYVSANAGDEFPASANEAITAYQTNSATYLTAHQAISAEEWNDCYDNVNTNSGAWGGSALPISAGPGIKVNLVDNTLVFSNDETVLYETTANNSVVTASESVYNFDIARFYMKDDNRDYAIIDLPACISANRAGNYMPFGIDSGDTTRLVYVQNNGDGVTWSADGKQKINSTAYSQIGIGYVFIKKIVGINRIAGGN
jgi:hypothetical protein